MKNNAYIYTHIYAQNRSLGCTAEIDRTLYIKKEKKNLNGYGPEFPDGGFIFPCVFVIFLLCITVPQPGALRMQVAWQLIHSLKCLKEKTLAPSMVHDPSYYSKL